MAFSILLAFGTLDPIFPIGSPINTIDIFFIFFIFTFIFMRTKGFLKILFSIDFYLLALIFILFILAQVLNGYSFLLQPLINYKFLLCIIFFLILSEYFSENYKIIHHSMIAFSIGCSVFSFIVLYISPELYQLHKGQLIVLNENPNSTSSRLVIAVIYLFYFVMKNPLDWGKLRLFGVLLLPSLIYMVVLSGSRGSLLSMVLAVYLIFLLSDISRMKKVVLSFTLFGFSLYLFKVILASDALGSRWEAALEGDTAGRTDIWATVIDIAYYNPLGVGETGYVEKISNIFGFHIDTHNLFLYVLICGGYLSLFLFLFLWIRVFMKSLSVYFHSKDVLPIAMFLNVLFLVSKTGGVITFLLFWFVFALVNGYQKSKNTFYVT